MGPGFRTGTNQAALSLCWLDVSLLSEQCLQYALRKCLSSDDILSDESQPCSPQQVTEPVGYRAPLSGACARFPLLSH